MTTPAQTQPNIPHPKAHNPLKNIEEQDFSPESLERQNLERFKELLVLDWRKNHARS